MLYLMAQQYNLEITPELTALWQEALRELTPSQVREGFVSWLKCESGHFKPAPGDILAHAPADAQDRPRARLNPDCKDCQGTGWRQTAARRGIVPVMTRCHCLVVEYQGEIYAEPNRQLPEPTTESTAVHPGPQAPEDCGDLIAQAVSSIGRVPERPEMTDEQATRKRDQLFRDLERHQQTKGVRA